MRDKRTVHVLPKRTQQRRLVRESDKRIQMVPNKVFGTTSLVAVDHFACTLKLIIYERRVPNQFTVCISKFIIFSVLTCQRFCFFWFNIFFISRIRSN